MLTAVMRPHHQDVVNTLQTAYQDCETPLLGTSPTNIYYCFNYLAFQHRDKDLGLGVCSQLELERQDENEYNFSYTEWGHHIVNRENTA